MAPFTLNDFLTWAKEPFTLVVVLDEDGAVQSVAHLVLHEDCVELEKLARNLDTERGSGRRLLTAVESIARQLGYGHVRLDAAGDALVRWYVTRGYTAVGPPREDSDWGPLTAMRKELA